MFSPRAPSSLRGSSQHQRLSLTARPSGRVCSEPGLADVASRAHQPERRMMPFPMKGEQADHRSFMLDTIALGSRPHALEAPAPPTMEPSDSYDPIVHLDWQTRAACRGMGSDLFFPTGGNAIAHLTRICARCPVAEECRTTALDDPSLYGIWAGTSVRERRRLRDEEELGWR
jgi:WhiB family redox-sensing transcriptional regulator